MAIGKLTIDQTASRASYGNVGPITFALQTAAEGRQKCLENVAAVANRGDRLSRIENKGDGLPVMARENAMHPPVEVALTSISRPVIHYDPTPHGYIDIFV